MEPQPLLLPLLLLLPLPLLSSPCCPLVTVSGTPAAHTDLEGVYTLQGEGRRREGRCRDGCVYHR